MLLRKKRPKKAFLTLIVNYRKIGVFQQTVAKVYYIVKILIFLDMEDDGQIPLTDS